MLGLRVLQGLLEVLQSALHCHLQISKKKNGWLKAGCLLEVLLVGIYDLPSFHGSLAVFCYLQVMLFARSSSIGIESAFVQVAVSLARNRLFAVTVVACRGLQRFWRTFGWSWSFIGVLQWSCHRFAGDASLYAAKWMKVGVVIDSNLGTIAWNKQKSRSQQKVDLYTIWSPLKHHHVTMWGLWTTSLPSF